MALRRPVGTFGSLASHPPTVTCCLKPRQKVVMEFHISRRVGAVVAGASLLLAKEVALGPDTAKGLDFGDRAGVPEFSLEEAERGIKVHAKSLLQVKDLLASGSWSEAQKELRKSSSNLKLDLYTIIQSKPGSERPQLRKLYSDLFNTVKKLDYAARDKDVQRVQQLYGDIVVAIEDILRRI